MPLNTRIDVQRPSAFTIRNHAFGSRPSTQADRTMPDQRNAQRSPSSLPDSTLIKR